jgi:hypothetical protein
MSQAYNGFPRYLDVLAHVEEQTIIKINKYINHLEGELGKRIKVP